MDYQYAYIYNSKQGIYYIQNGLIPIDFGTGNKGDAFMKFENTEQYRNLFRDWCNLQNKQK